MLKIYLYFFCKDRGQVCNVFAQQVFLRRPAGSADGPLIMQLIPPGLFSSSEYNARRLR